MKRLIFFLCLFMTSCATDYSCGQFPSSGCLSISKAYETSNDDIHDYREDLYEKNRKARRSNSKSSTKRSEIRSNAVAFEQTDPGRPLYKKPKVLRILLGDWIDNQGDLHKGGYVFVKVRGGEWDLKN